MNGSEGGIPYRKQERMTSVHLSVNMRPMCGASGRTSYILVRDHNQVTCWDCQRKIKETHP